MFLKLKAKNSKFKIIMLNNDVLGLINNLTSIKCHVCNIKYKLQHLYTLTHLDLKVL